MKVAELEGALLDLWVARAENVEVYADSNGDMWEGNRTYRPSTDWARGGPIIERERIGVDYLGHGCWKAGITQENGVYAPDAAGQLPLTQHGETALEAAMRVYVASKFGDEVPDLEKPL